MGSKHGRRLLGAGLSAAAAGSLNGLFGGGGGMLLIPGLKYLSGMDEKNLFPVSVSVMLPVSILSLTLTAGRTALPWQEAAPYLIGSAAGGLLAGLFGRRIPTLWLHRILGVMLLWGGVRYLW